MKVTSKNNDKEQLLDIIENNPADWYRHICDGKYLNMMVDELISEIEKLPKIPQTVAGVMPRFEPLVFAMITKAHLTGHPTKNALMEADFSSNNSRTEHIRPFGVAIITPTLEEINESYIERLCRNLTELRWPVHGVVALVNRIKNTEIAGEAPVRSVFDL